jgi:hypothetical protein
MPKSVQPLVFGLHKHYLEKLKPASKTIRLADVIDWIIVHLKSEYGVPNLIRMAAETIKPPVSVAPVVPSDCVADLVPLPVSPMSSVE